MPPTTPVPRGTPSRTSASAVWPRPRARSLVVGRLALTPSGDFVQRRDAKQCVSTSSDSVHEPGNLLQVKVSKATKAPDYSFRRPDGQRLPRRYVAALLGGPGERFSLFV